MAKHIKLALVSMAVAVLVALAANAAVPSLVSMNSFSGAIEIMAGPAGGGGSFS